MRGAVSVRAFELENDIAIRIHLDAFVGERRPGNVAEKPFQLAAIGRGAIGVGV